MTLTDAEIAEGYVLACSCLRREIWFSHNRLMPDDIPVIGYLTVSASFFSHPFPLRQMNKLVTVITFRRWRTMKQTVAVISPKHSNRQA